MFTEARGNGGPHWVKNKIYPGTAGMLCSWNKVAISGDHHYLIYRSTLRKRCYVETNSHIDTFLSDFEFEISLLQILYPKSPRTKLLQRISLQHIAILSFKFFTATKCNLSLVR